MSVPIQPTELPTSVTDEQIRDIKQMIKTYNKLAQSCFQDCVTDFTSRAVKGSEERCTMSCVEKVLKVNQRISDRFQEYQVMTNENALALAQKLKDASPGNSPASS